MMFRFASVASLLTASAAFLATSAAHAGQSCKYDSECAKGATCQVVAESGCAAPAPCPPGADCEMPPPCTSVQIHECVELPPPPVECATDADCAAGEACYAHELTSCTTVSPACPPGADCPVEPQLPCTVSVIHACVPRFELPCQADADCGDSFSCVQDVAPCACSGGTSGSAGGSAGGAPTDPTIPPGGATPPDKCECAPATTSHCEPHEIECKTTADCPSTWTCEQSRDGSTGWGCTGSAGGANTPGSAGAPNGTGGASSGIDCGPIPTPASPSLCVPPYRAGVDAPGGFDGSAGVGGATAGGLAGEPPATSGGTETSSNGKSVEGPSSNDSSGCQMSTSPAHGSAGAFLAVLGFLGLARRRRSIAA